MLIPFFASRIFFVATFAVAFCFIHFTKEAPALMVIPLAFTDFVAPAEAVAPMKNETHLAVDRAGKTTVIPKATTKISPASINIQATSIAAAVQTPSSEVGKPAWFSIPKINVSSSIEHIGLTAQGAVGAPETAYSVSWFTGGARPGQLGSAVISGHTGIWKNGSHSIFDNLHTLTVGDTIFVKDEYGTTRTFVIKETRVYGKDDIAPEIFNRSEGTYLNIITCHGKFLPSLGTYSQRFVVFAELQ